MEPEFSLVPFGYLVDGPHASLYVASIEQVEGAIAEVCESNGDDPDDYTATELYAKGYAMPPMDLAGLH